MISRLESFLFAEADPSSASLLRIWLAILAIVVFYPSDGASASALIRTPWIEQLYAQVFLTLGYWALASAALLVFATGVRPRPLGLLCCFLLAPCVPVAGRTAGRYLAWFAVTACALLRSDGRFAVRGAGGPVGPVWPVRLIQLQLSALYLVNAAAKTTPGYLGGGALEAMSQQLPNFHLDLSGGVFPLVGVEIPLWIAASASAAIEYALALGFWVPRLRWFTAALGVAFHLGLMAIISIGRLDVVAVSLYTTFLLPWEMSEARRGTLSK